MAATAGVANSGFLGSLDEQDQRDLRAVATVRRYDNGTTLLFEGQRSPVVFVLLEGRVKITSVAENGRQQMLGIAGPGDLLGELAAIDASPHSASAVTAEPATALALSSTQFREFLANHAAVTFRLLESVVHRVRTNDRKRLEYGAYDVGVRVARRLLELADAPADPGGDALQITVPLTQDDLAGLVGASREQVVRSLRSLRDEGAVETGRRTLTILDVDLLKERAR